MIDASFRQFLPNLAELIDRMCVTQIKMIYNGKDDQDFKSELSKLENDISLILDQKSIIVRGHLIRLIISLSQINLHIWHNKDLMQENLNNESRYLEILKFAHQINGVRNSIKNKIIEIEGLDDKSQIKSNFETDGLNWSV